MSDRSRRVAEQLAGIQAADPRCKNKK